LPKKKETIKSKGKTIAKSKTRSTRKKIPKEFIVRSSTIHHAGSTDELAEILDLHNVNMYANDGLGNLEQISTIKDIPKLVRESKWRFVGRMETVSDTNRYYGYRFEGKCDIYPEKNISRVNNQRQEDLEIAGDFSWSDFYFTDENVAKDIANYHKKAKNYIKKYFPNSTYKNLTEEPN